MKKKTRKIIQATIIFYIAFVATLYAAAGIVAIAKQLSSKKSAVVAVQKNQPEPESVRPVKKLPAPKILSIKVEE